MTQAGTGAPGPLTLKIVPGKLGANTAPFTITGTDYFGGTDAVVVDVVPTTGMVNNYNGTWTATRPENSAGNATYTARAVCPGYNTVLQQFVVLAKDAVALNAPQLALGNVSFNSTYYTINYSGTWASIKWLKDGADQGDPGSSPLLFYRDSSDHEITLRATGQDTTTIDIVVHVLAVPQTLTDATDLTTALSELATIKAILQSHGMA